MSKFKIYMLLSIIGSANAKISEVASLKDFEKEIDKDDVPTIIMFQSPQCPACKAMTPVFDSAAKKYDKKANFMRVDTTQKDLQNIAKNYGINGVPTIVYKESGYKPTAEFNRTVEAVLGITAKPAKPNVVKKNGAKVVKSKKKKN